jgi:hypothetical protein
MKPLEQLRPSDEANKLRSVEVHPANRWGTLIGRALSCRHDLTTIGAWAKEAGICETQLRLRCRLAGVRAKVSLDFVRVLRAVLCRELRGGAITDYLDIGDTRTMKRLFARVGVTAPEKATLAEYIRVQHVIRDEALTEEIKHLLKSLAILRDADRFNN